MTVRLNNTSKGILYLITSAFFFALMAVFVRLSGDLFFMQKAFFRNLVAFIIAFAGIFKDLKTKGREAIAIPKGALLYLFLRAIAGTVGIFGNFYAIDHLVLSDASILNKMAPFFAIVFSLLLTKEKIKPIPLLAVIIAFLGAMLVVKPSFNFTQMVPTLSGFMSGVGAGFAYACVRKLGLLKCNGKIIIVFFSGFSLLLCLPYLIFCFEPMTWLQLLFLIGAGSCAAAGQFTITAAYFYAPAGKISIYDYTQIIFSTALGLIFFGDLPDWLSVTGYLIIIAMAVMNFVYNLRQDKIAAAEVSIPADASPSENQNSEE